MTSMFPAEITLTSEQALDILAALESAIEALMGDERAVGLAFEAQDAAEILWEKLIPPSSLPEGE